MRWWLATFAASVLLASAPNAAGFCRARGCESDDTRCLEQDGCVVTGPELFWPSGCVGLGVQRDGSPRNGIDYAAFEEAVRVAFTSWQGADCGTGTPDIQVEIVGLVDCGFDTAGANAIRFRDDEWPYVGGEDELGHALVTYDAETGEILDADIEINGTVPVALGGVDGADLASVLTHEAGHFFGLDHSSVPDATMSGRYQPDFASLEPDDVAGICSIYPPRATAAAASCERRTEFENDCAGEYRALAEVPYCGTAFPRRSGSRVGLAIYVAGACAIELLRRRLGARPTRSET